MVEVDYGQVTGMVHSTESFGSVDGPGIRFIIFCRAARCVASIAIIQTPGLWKPINLNAEPLMMS